MFFVMSFLMAISCSGPQDMRTLKLAHALDPSHSVHKAMLKMAEELDKLSKGKMKMEVYPSQQLGTERELLELIQIGAIDLTKTSAAVLENFSPLMKLLSIPYLFSNDQHLLDVFQGPIGREILEDGTRYHLRGLCFFDAGKRSFYTIDRRVEKPEDLEGLKIRVQSSPSAIKLVRGMGAAATPIPFGELYTALQQGVVDGAENNPPSFYLTRHYEVCNYYIIDEHTSVPDVLIVSEHTWKKLTLQERQWLQEATVIAQTYQFELWKKSEEEAMEAVRNAGVEVIYPNKELFASKVQSLSDDIIEGEYMRTIYNRILDAGKN